MAAPQPNQSQAKPAPRSRRGAVLWPAVAVLLGAVFIHNALQSHTDLRPHTRPAGAAPAATRATAAAAEQTLPRSAPTRLWIPEIAVDAPFTGLSLGASGRLDAPPVDDTNLVGWFLGGASPGERGSSIVVGHLDTRTGPAVFAKLRRLKPGSMVHVFRADSMVVSFTVYSVKTFSKARFPNERVYADTPSPQMRLITCGGEYDRSAQSYEDNVVVFARLHAAHRA
ncbi:class F sortase [Streptomyces phyllanthi]|uniref:Class F sortase n=1 Tax=Streptomyces phyllanthi TaxID=1803180 RepID=A0A5N8W2K7_9ACTN|nr:class F sortase [Streptomyces phyllanthi]MPY41146.1 class F sortase [Streptomyces phyllanthi]